MFPPPRWRLRGSELHGLAEAAVLEGAHRPAVRASCRIQQTPGTAAALENLKSPVASLGFSVVPGSLAAWLVGPPGNGGGDGQGGAEGPFPWWTFEDCLVDQRRLKINTASNSDLYSRSASGKWPLFRVPGALWLIVRATQSQPGNVFFFFQPLLSENRLTWPQFTP